MSNFWLNIDIPTRICTVHSDKCSFVKKIMETMFKGVGELKRDSGWLKFKSMNEINSYFKLNFEGKGFILRKCLVCLK